MMIYADDDGDDDDEQIGKYLMQHENVVLL